MKRNDIKVLLAWAIASGSWCIAEEHTSSTKIAPPPPPAIKSPYFTNESFGGAPSTGSQVDASEESSENATKEKQSPVKESAVSNDEEDTEPIIYDDVQDDSEHDSKADTKEKSEDASKSAKDTEKQSDDEEDDSDVKDASASSRADTSEDVGSSDKSDSGDSSIKEDDTHPDDSSPDVSTEDSQPKNDDASTGVHGAHVTKGIDFESSDHEDKFSIGGVDTSHTKHSSGNWIEKKHYWHEIEGVVDQVKEKIADITQQRMAFFATRSEVDKELSTFYQHVGLDQGPLQDMIHYALEIMEKEKEHQGYLNRKERTFYDKAQSKQRIFEQLKEDVKAIGVIDTKIDEALEVVLKQINTCTEYEGEVWNIYKTVAYELSEHDAEQHYLTAQAFLKDIENIQMYLSGPFQAYFQELAQSMQTHTQNIVMQLDALEKEGLDLKKEAVIFESLDESEQKQAATNEESHKKEEKSSDKKSGTSKEKSKSFSLVDYISHFFTSVKDSIVSAVKKVAGFFTWRSKKSDIPVAKKATEPALHVEEHVSQEPVAADHLQDVQISEKVTTASEKKDVAVAKKPSHLEQTVEYDEQRFKQEMEELKKSIESGVNDIASAPGDMLHSFEKKSDV